MTRRSLVLTFVASFGLASRIGAQDRATPVAVTLGRSVVTLTGPWTFQLGDDARWAGPDFDDSSWEIVDLAAPPGDLWVLPMCC